MKDAGELTDVEFNVRKVSQIITNVSCCIHVVLISLMMCLVGPCIRQLDCHSKTEDDTRHPRGTAVGSENEGDACNSFHLAPMP